ncbi:Uncharacterised protein [Mycoplasmopsis columboralis]|uniref:Uncharacterized protein n=1 Tax=Mycoplasmopsis columboralis TaxID=171282 RepID=A0A449B6I4_9BACT|nr:hypothetical protein [Mycoplasmopsis columboralis]VEU76217.1 Uncharacterised protein [Mycoplasmopsis columboralis]
MTDKELSLDQDLNQIVLSSWSDKKVPNGKLRPYESVLVEK